MLQLSPNLLLQKRFASALLFLALALTAVAQKYEEKAGYLCDFTLVKQNEKFGLWENSKQYLKTEYDEIKLSKNKDCKNKHQHLLVRKKKKWGAMDLKGQPLLPIAYDSILPVSGQNMLLLYKSGKTGLYASEPNKQTEAIYTKILFSEDYPTRILVEQNEKWGIIDHSLNFVAEPKYDAIEFPKELPYFMVTLKNLRGFIHTSGKVTVPAVYEGSGQFSSDHVAAVKQNGKWGFIDTSGKVLIDFKFERASDMSDDWSQVVYNGEDGRCDLKGNFIRNITYDYDKGFNEHYNHRQVKKNNKYGYVNKFNKLVVPCEYDDAFECSQGVAVVTKGGKSGIISMKNEVLVPLQYKTIYYYFPGIFVLHSFEDKFALVNRQGKIVTEWLDKIYGMENGYGVAEKGNRSGKIAPSGMISWNQTDLEIYKQPKYLNNKKSRIIHEQKDKDYMINLEILNDQNKILLLSARVKKESKTYWLEITQLNAKSYAVEKKSVPVELIMANKKGLRKFVKVSDGYLLVTYNLAAWFDKNLNLIHKIHFGNEADGFAHDFCADVAEVGQGQKKYIMLKVLKDGQGIVSGLDLATKKESAKPYRLYNPFLLVSEISGKIFEVNDQNILIIHKGSEDRKSPYHHYSFYNMAYNTTLIDYAGLFNGAGISDKDIYNRNTGYSYFSQKIGSFFSLDAVWMGQDGYLHFIAGTEKKPFTSYEVAISIEPNDGNYKKMYSRQLFGQVSKTYSQGQFGMTSALHIRQLNNGFHATSGISETHYGMMDLFDQHMNYLGTFSVSDDIVNRNESRAHIEQYPILAWNQNNGFYESLGLSYKYTSYYNNVVNDNNINRSFAFCESGNPGKFLFMYQHFIAEVDIKNVNRYDEYDRNAEYIAKASDNDYSSTDDNNSNTDDNSAATNKGKTMNSNTKTAESKTCFILNDLSSSQMGGKNDIKIGFQNYRLVTANISKGKSIEVDCDDVVVYKLVRDNSTEFKKENTLFSTKGRCGQTIKLSEFWK